MATQLENFVAAGGQIAVKGRTFTLEGVASDSTGAVGTFTTSRASYTGVECINAKVAGRPGAEVWSIIGGRRAIADFAIHDGKLLPLG